MAEPSIKDYRQKSEFNKDLTGEELERVMFGQTTMTVEVSPLGQVRGNQNTLTQMGISLPMDPGSGGGFELPSFPTQPVTVGDRWTENGTILNRYGGDTPQGQWVYQLSRISPSAKGRVAIIRYRKVTDLSRMNLGGMQGLSAGSLGSLGETPSPEGCPSLAAIGGLVINWRVKSSSTSIMASCSKPLSRAAGTCRWIPPMIPGNGKPASNRRECR